MTDFYNMTDAELDRRAAALRGWCVIAVETKELPRRVTNRRTGATQEFEQKTFVHYEAVDANGLRLKWPCGTADAAWDKIPFKPALSLDQAWPLFIDLVDNWIMHSIDHDTIKEDVRKVARSITVRWLEFKAESEAAHA